MNRSRHVRALSLGLVFLATAGRGQPAWPEQNRADSVSGQFTVWQTGGFSPLLHDAALATNASFIRLEPALLVVAAERFKQSLWNQLGLKSGTPWRGKIFLTLRPARSPGDGVTLTSSWLLQKWNYQVELPDVLLRPRYARALAAVVLLEIANRNAADHSAELPTWLADGLAQSVLATDGAKDILSAPAHKLDGLAQSRLDQTTRGVDSLADVRRVLRDAPALTFEQLSWPTEAQVDGRDGGVYLASAQLFTHELFGLKNGAEKMRALLAQLPRYRNWQTAFYAAFRDNFHQPLDVEKWWTLQLVNLAAHDPGARWTPAFSRDRLAELLAVPVESRSRSNALPVHTVISLQAALRSFTPEQQAAVLRLKLRDLERLHFRLAPPFAALADGYHRVLAEFLGEQNKTAATGTGRNLVIARRPADIKSTLDKLDALDRHRREAEARVNTGPLPLNLNRGLR